MPRSGAGRRSSARDILVPVRRQPDRLLTGSWESCSDGEASGDALSNASTPTQTSQQSHVRARSEMCLRWPATGEEYNLARGIDQCGLTQCQPVAVLEGRLYLMSTPEDPEPTHGVHFFTMDKVMKYMPFCADFGPFNLGMMHHFNEVLKRLMSSPRLRKSKIVYYTANSANDTTNAIFLLGSFLVCHLNATPEQAWMPFCNLKGAVRPFRDATWVASPYDLHVRDCWAGLARAIANGLYDPCHFDEDEYFYYDHPSNGDMHEVVKGKFFAFKGPTGRRKSLGFGRYTLIPSDYIDVFRVKNIRTVVRLNDKEYDRSALLQAGFNHHDLFFIDCSVPTDEIVDSFLRIAEQSEGAIAVHCLAGLGRTGTLIGLYMMKHLGFTANEAIGWMRTVRPGSVIGPQQQYLADQEVRMHSLGAQGAVGLGLNHSAGLRSPSSPRTGGRHAAVPPPPWLGAQSPSSNSEQLAQMVTRGMQIRDQGRFDAGANAMANPVSETNSGTRTPVDSVVLPPRIGGPTSHVAQPPSPQALRTPLPGASAQRDCRRSVPGLVGGGASAVIRDCLLPSRASPTGSPASIARDGRGRLAASVGTDSLAATAHGSMAKAASLAKGSSFRHASGARSARSSPKAIAAGSQRFGLARPHEGSL